MKENIPQNIVEAYTIAAKIGELDPEQKYKAFDEVISFCEGDANCWAEDTLKRNTLLFWAYDKLAQSKMKEAKYTEALDLWEKAQNLVQSSQSKVKLGNKILEAIEKSKIGISDKAKRIVRVTAYLQKVYSEIGDNESMNRMERLQNVAAFLLGNSKTKH